MGSSSWDRDDTRIKGATDDTHIGNVGDRLKVDASVTVTPSTITFANILRENEIAVVTKVRTDLPSSSYTVPAEKTFALTSFGGSFDTQSPMYLRFEKQTGGVGAWDVLFRVTLKQHGQDESNSAINLSHAIIVGTAGDVFKITYESALSKGTLWSGFTGIEY